MSMKRAVGDWRPSRRQFVQGVAAASTTLLAGCALPGSRPAPPRVARVGLLVGSLGEATALPPPGAVPSIDALRQGLRDQGYTEGENLVIEFH